MSISQQHDDGDPGFQIAPMIDVVFVLMLFFMACAASGTVERELPVQLPRDRGPAVAIDLVITGDGALLLNGAPIADPGDSELQALTTWLRHTREAFGDADPMIVHPAPTVKHERLMQALNAAARAGWRRVSFG